MNIWGVIWVVLMMFWLFGGGYYSYTPGTTFNFAAYGFGMLIPWACVLIVGLHTFSFKSNNNKI